MAGVYRTSGKMGGTERRTMDKKKRGCLWAGCGVAIAAVMVGIAVLGGAAWLVYDGSSLRVEQREPAEARRTFDDARRRFGGRPPLVTVGPDGSTRVVPGKEPGTAGGEAPRPIASLHVMTWKPGSGEFAQVQLPFWLVRLGGAKGKVRLNGEDTLADLARVNVTIEDIVSAGPGLVVDHQQRDGTQVLIWTE
jgi:hypothetical protein